MADAPKDRDVLATVAQVDNPSYQDNLKVRRDPDGSMWIVDAQGRKVMSGVPADQKALGATISDGRVRVSAGAHRIATNRGTGTKAPYALLGGPSLKASDVSPVGGTGTVELVERNGQKALKIEIPAGAVNFQLSINGCNGAAFAGDLYIVLEGSGNTGLLKLDAYIAPGATVATNYVQQSNLSFPASPQIDSWQDQGGAWTWRSGRKNSGITGTIDFPFVVGSNKLTITPISGQAATMYLYAVGYGQPRKGRVVVTQDDVWGSWYKSGAPLWHAAGIPTSCTIMPSVVGTFPTYATHAQLTSYIESGGRIYGHGPNKVYDAGHSLILNYPNGDTDGAIADIDSTLQAIYDNGWDTPGFDLTYAWPQGQFQWFPGDTRLLEAAYEYGLRLVRCSSQVNPLIQFVTEGATRLNRLALPNTPHGWAGSTASQVAQIQSVVQTIQNAGTYGTDIFLLFHQVVPDSTLDAQMATDKIRYSDMITILNAVKAEIAAGRMEATTLGDLALDLSDSPYFWGRLG